MTWRGFVRKGCVIKKLCFIFTIIIYFNIIRDGVETVLRQYAKQGRSTGIYVL